MMKNIDFRLIPIEEVNYDKPNTQFPENEVDRLAQSILETGGLLFPLVVTPTGIESYKLLQGGLNYYAALKAQEKDPRAAEMVSAFVVESDDLAVTEAQLQILSGLTASPPPTSVSPDPDPPILDLKPPVDHIKTTVDNSELSSELLLSLIQSQEKQLSQLVSTFEALTQSQEKRFSQLMNVLEKLSASQGKADPPKSKPKLTKDALKQIAQKHGLKVSSKDTKDQIIELLRQNSIPLSE